MSLDISTGAGDSADGFIVQKDPYGLRIAAGRRADTGAAFGVTNDANGLAINVREVSPDGFTVHIFTEDGVFVVPFDLYSWVLVVGAGANGGGGENQGAGGGGGQVISEEGVMLSGSLPVVIGMGGLGSTTLAQNDGGTTTFAGLTAIGGGAGAAYALMAHEGASGGGNTGGIPGVYSRPGAAGLAGHKGGDGSDGMETYMGGTAGGGGGGAGGPGGDARGYMTGETQLVTGDGGPGLLIDIVPTVTRPCPYYGAGGGAVSSVSSYPVSGGAGGSPGGPWYAEGRGNWSAAGGSGFPTSGSGDLSSLHDAQNHAGYPNSGSGGGAGSQLAYGGPNKGCSGDGADGIVVVRYDGAPKAMGGTVIFYDAEGNVRT